jgi:hypothetical protein
LENENSVNVLQQCVARQLLAEALPPQIPLVKSAQASLELASLWENLTETVLLVLQLRAVQQPLEDQVPGVHPWNLLVTSVRASLSEPASQ